MSFKARNSSKKDDKKQKWFKTYLQDGHDGTKHGHDDWKSKGELYFTSKKEHLIAKVLNGSFDVQPLIECWPFVPEGWKPTIIGTPRRGTVKKIKDVIPTEAEILKDEMSLIELEDKKKLHEEALNSIVLEVEDSPETESIKDTVDENSTEHEAEEESKDDAVPPVTYADALKTPAKETEPRSAAYFKQLAQKNIILKCRVQIRNLKRKIDDAKELRADADEELDDDEPRIWGENDIIFQDNKRMKPITIYAQDMEDVSPDLMLWMSTTAGDVTKGSIKKLEVGYKDSPIKGFIVLDRLNLKFGKDTSTTGNVGMIGKAVSLKFMYGKESGISYLDRMLDMIEEVVGHDELVEKVKSALPTIFLGRIHQPRFGSYCDLAVRILLDPEFKQLSLGPYKEFRAKLHTTEQTMKCYSKSVVAVKTSKDAKKVEQERANAAKESKEKKKKKGNKDNESANGAHDSEQKKATCFNCENKKSMLKHYKVKPHKTGDCPFEQSKKQREYYRKGKTAVDMKLFPEFAQAAQLSSSSSTDGSQE